MRTAAFASGVRGPVDFKALRRLASICLMVAIYVSFFSNIFSNKQCQMGAFTAGVWSYFSAKAPGHFGVDSYFYYYYIASRRGSEPHLSGGLGLNGLL